MSAVVEEEIEGLIRVFSDGRVERFPIVEEVPAALSPEFDVASADVVIDPATLILARLYAPVVSCKKTLPTLVYFHGGGFCVGSASWRNYHEFLAKVSASAECLIMSVNYRLAPENRLPAAYDDGVAAVKWLRRREKDEGIHWWASRVDFSRVFVGGDSAGGAIAYNVSLRVGSRLRGIILIQPFFGGEDRKNSETREAEPGSALSLESSDAYWRLALPPGLTRDHPWCNPLMGMLGRTRLPPYLVFVAETDVLHDRSVEFCEKMKKAGRSVEVVVHGGVGHAFQVLGFSRVARARAQEMISEISSFLGK